MEEELRARLGLYRLLCAVDLSDPVNRRLNVASLVAAYLDKFLLDGNVVAVGLGRNVSALTKAPGVTLPRDVLFVSEIGGSAQSGEMVNADHIARRLAARLGAVAKRFMRRRSSRAKCYVLRYCAMKTSGRHSAMLVAPRSPFSASVTWLRTAI